MYVLTDVLRGGDRQGPFTPEAVVAHAAEATLSAGVLLAGTVLAARRFNEDRSRLPTLLAAGLLGRETIAATVEVGRSTRDLMHTATGAFVGHALFGSQES